MFTSTAYGSGYRNIGVKNQFVKLSFVFNLFEDFHCLLSFCLFLSSLLDFGLTWLLRTANLLFSLLNLVYILGIKGVVDRTLGKLLE